MVHNGTIENYAVLKAALAQRGYAFASDTDTEVLVQLVDYIQTVNGCCLMDAVKEALVPKQGKACAPLWGCKPFAFCFACASVGVRRSGRPGGNRYLGFHSPAQFSFPAEVAV